ncbi:terminase [Microaceticoccus formicicus]|uniref:terminase n=1 Tax=Microaceticoccus formicicus TaxID=3118105 RepID=UPI003CD03DB2|nr:terminase [Peptoniphilaceae bacterium AMB_02]
MAKTRLGNQIPTQSVILPYRKSKYKEAIEIYEQSGRTAQKWQIDLTKHILATNKDGLWTHTKFGYSLPRRNGKNEVVAIRELYGLMKGELILHTAHRTTTSHAAWERLLRMLDKAGIEYDSLRAIGRERIELPDTGGRVEFRTRTSTGGLGEGFDLLVIDEAQEYTDDQESALKYVVTDSQNPQTLFCGTPPTPISSGTVFTNLRNSTLEGSTPNGGWAEWGVGEQSDIRDKELWYLTNPSLGTIFTERSIEDEIGSDEVDFNIQRLGLWIKYNQKSVISQTEWESLQVKRLPKLEGKLFVGVKYGHDGANVAMSIAVKTASNKVFVESIDCQSVRNGNAWLLNFLGQADVQTIVIDGQGGQQLLAAELKEQKIKGFILPTVKEIILANSSFEQGLYQQSICHKGQPSLSQVVTNCEKRNIGSGGGFGYKSQFEDYDISLMDSMILAHWACSEAKPPRKQKIRY